MVSSFLLVARRWSGTFSTIVVPAVAACPSVAVVVAALGLDACSAKLLAQVGDGNLEIDKVLKVNEEMYVGGSAIGGEGTIGRSASYDQGAITGSGCRKVGDGFYRFTSIGMIG